MNLTPENRKKLTKWLIGIAAACILIFLGVQNISAVAGAFKWLLGIAMPLLVGWAIAIIINVPMRFLETHLWRKSKKPFLIKIRRPVALVLSLVFIIGSLVLMGVKNKDMFGVDLSGGSVVVYNYKEAVPQQKIVDTVVTW